MSSLRCLIYGLGPRRGDIGGFGARRSKLCDGDTPARAAARAPALSRRVARRSHSGGADDPFEPADRRLSAPLRNATFYGLRGVQLFFIVSGLTLMMNYAGKPFHPLNFAARRFFRIAPMFYLGALLYLLLSHATTLSFPTAAATPIDIAVTFLFLHGWLPSAINTVVPGGWSIAAEAMFYLLFPALLRAGRHPRLMTVLLIGTYLLAASLNFGLRHLLPATPEGANFAFSFWLVQLPAFAGGCWLAIAGPAWQPLRGVAGGVLAASVAGLLIDSQLRGHSNLLVAIALLSVFVWACGAARPRFLEGRVLPLIGQISFGLYILQFAVLALLHPLAGAIEAALGPAGALVVIFALALAVSGALAYATYRWIELPMIRATRRLGLRHAAGGIDMADVPIRADAAD